MDADHEIAEWTVRTDDERKLLSVTGTQVDAGRVRSLVKTAGFEVFDEILQLEEKLQAPAETFFPLKLIFFYLVGFVAISQFRAGRVDWMVSMNTFMGGFFVVFSFFKLLNLRAFADAYRSYDIVTRDPLDSRLRIRLSVHRAGVGHRLPHWICTPGDESGELCLDVGWYRRNRADLA